MSAPLAATSANPPASSLGAGVAFALAAGLLWGLVFVTPLWLPDVPAALLSVGRYLAFGLVCLPLAWVDRGALRGLARSDWLEAAKLSLVGNFLYYGFLAAAIQRAGAPLPTMIIGTLPVAIALVSNRRDAARDGRLTWQRLAPSLLLITAGLSLVHAHEWGALKASGGGAGDARRYWEGALLAVLAMGCWTWYPIRNADWLRTHAGRSPRVWATAQGLVTLPMALAALALLWALHAAGTGWGDVAPNAGAAGAAAYDWPLGADPWRFIGLMLALGLLASWLGTWCWNQASQRLPTNLAGQLIVFETLAALLYAFALRGHWPGMAPLLGAALLVAGVVVGVSGRRG